MVGTEAQLISNISKLEFRTSDIKILLITQGHYDHVGTLSKLQQISGADVYSTRSDAPILKSGGLSDPYLDRQKDACLKR